MLGYIRNNYGDLVDLALCFLILSWGLEGMGKVYEWATEWSTPLSYVALAVAGVLAFVLALVRLFAWKR